MGDELTVEEALEELREMFPDMTLQVDVSAWYWRKDGDDAEAERDTKITVGLFGGSKVFHAATSSDCMAQVRAFKQSQEQER